MTFSRTHFFQVVRWAVVGLAIVLSVWMLYAGVTSTLRMPLSWTTPLVWFMFLLFTTPMAMTAYFGIRGEYRSFFTTIVLIISFLIFIFSSSALSRVPIRNIYTELDHHGLLGALAGFLLSLFHFAAPFIFASWIYRGLMKLLLTAPFSSLSVKANGSDQRLPSRTGGDGACR